MTALALLTYTTMSVHTAESVSIVLSVALPSDVADALTSEMITPFESAHPGVSVNIVRVGADKYYPPAANDSEKFWTGITNYVSKADVLYVNNQLLNSEATQAGFFLNLSPLIEADNTIYPDNFITPAWESFQWDGGIWAVPANFDEEVLTYDPSIFDKAGVSYPTSTWTLDDLANAARKLTIKDQNGQVVIPGLLAYDFPLILRSASGQGFYDTSHTPNPPQLYKSEFISSIATWVQLLKDTSPTNFKGDPQDIAMRLESGFDLIHTDNNHQRIGTLLPGGKVGIKVNGFAASAGTQYPDLSYTLVKFLISSPAIQAAFSNLTPALKSLQSNQTVAASNNQRFLDLALSNAIPVSELRYSDYLNKAVDILSAQNIGVDTALEQVQALAQKNIQTETSQRNSQAIAVATPNPTLTSANKNISLKFDMVTSTNILTNSTQWDQEIKNFVDSDPEVGQITLNTDAIAIDKLTSNYDCFILPANQVFDTDLTKLLPLDPFLNIDPSFSSGDELGNTLTQVQNFNHTWALPIYIQPEVLRYNSSVFSKEGIFLNDNTWSISKFIASLRSLKIVSVSPPFVAHQLTNTYLLMLIAAYGGLPLDFRTTPITVNFDDPATVDAIRQVLDLAKSGYIDYIKLTGSGGMAHSGSSSDLIYTSSLSLLEMPPSGSSSTTDPYKIVGYPIGSKYIPVSYTVGYGYISAASPHPDACYRWLSHIATRTDLLSSMPTRRSLLTNTGVTSQGADIAAFYDQFASSIDDHNSVIIPTEAYSPESFILNYWLDRVFDRYMFENADLESELHNAASLAKDFHSCTSKLEASDSTMVQDKTDYFNQIWNCAYLVDPLSKSHFAAPSVASGK